jgi:hypothetical protein
MRGPAILPATTTNSVMKNITKDQFVDVLDSVGITDEQKKRLHSRFEQEHPEAHQDFLESLGIPAAEIRRIRHDSQAGAISRRSIRRKG